VNGVASLAPLRGRRTLADRVRSAVLRLADGAGRVLTHEERAWASITFAGTRHELVLRFEGIAEVDAGERLIERFEDADFTIPGHLVADAIITVVDHQFGSSETLTVTAVVLLLEQG
jgi:hypothetical protein